MINSVNYYAISQIFDTESDWLYEVPKYQREYTWGKSHWESLYDDLVDNETGYFLGSIICINQSEDTFQAQKLELVDGQQRLITLTLLFAAIYTELSRYQSQFNDEQRAESINIKWRLVLKKKTDTVRLIPQIQNQNFDDFLAVLGSAGVIAECKPPRFAPNRRIFKAYRYFLDRISKSTRVGEQVDFEKVEDILAKVNNACVVKIEVSSHADAYTLFESLNDRGMPLNAVDLIKNKLLAKADATDPTNVGLYFEKWLKLLDYLGDDNSTQERFFRHFFNAFQTELSTSVREKFATRSNLIRIYEQLLANDMSRNLDLILDAGSLYSHILSRAENEDFQYLIDPLKNLERIQGSPSHVLVLYLMARKQDLNLTNSDLSSVVDFLVRFFVRRNLTDTPSTRDLTRLFSDVIESIQKQSSTQVVNSIKSKLRDISASDEIFRTKLVGPIYDENAGVTRFILCALAHKEMTKETQLDLWKTEKGKFVWTVEHIFPQGENIPESWVDMVADGDVEEAASIQSEHGHTLGNLTMSGFNVNLGNKSFEEKRDLKDSEGRPVGFKNTFPLNVDVASAQTWNVASIQERTTRLVDEAMRRFSIATVDE